MLRLLLSFLFVLVQLTHSNKIEYNSMIAAKMANLSAAVYTLSNQPNPNCPECHPSFHIHKTTQTKHISEHIYASEQLAAMVGHDSQLNLTTLVFRGSINVLQAAINQQNISAIFSRWYHCRRCPLNLGFFSAYNFLSNNGLQNIIVEALEAYPSTGLIFTGHSLGGAFANFASLRFAEELGYKYPNHTVLCYTFGQPKVGTGNYAKQHAGGVPDHFRIVNKADGVPHMPRDLLREDQYEHSGVQVWYSNGAEQQPRICERDYKVCSGSLAYFLHNFEDHDLKEYSKLFDGLQQHRKNDDL